MKNSLENKSISELLLMLENKETTSLELVEYYHKNILLKKDLGLINEVYYDEAKKLALLSDEKRQNGEKLGRLEGVVYILKDNINSLGHKTTCSSNFLKNFTSPYDATLVKKLKDAGAILLAKANMDEFGMGSTTENSAFQVAKNPLNPDHVPGGSSGGSAGAVAADLAAFSIGTDTGGSIRQPSSFCGTVGLKPTYGRVSRYGVVAFASSLDQAGPITKTAEDAGLVLSVIAGDDIRENTISKAIVKDFSANKNADIKGRKIAFDYDLVEKLENEEIKSAIKGSIKEYEKLGAEIVPVNLDFLEYSIPVYYVISSAEASSNLSRYDGVRYGSRSKDSEKLEDLYINSKNEGFGKEVKRRIMLGNFVLSSGYFDAYYNKARKIRQYLKNKMAEIYKKADILVLPTTPTTAYKIGDKTSSPLEMYLGDIFTVFVNLVGLPAISIPCGTDSKKLPIGLQIVGKEFCEDEIINFAHKLKKGVSYEI